MHKIVQNSTQAPSTHWKHNIASDPTDALMKQTLILKTLE